MKVSVKMEYALRALVHMARRQPTRELSHIEEMSRTEAIPANYLVQILTELRSGGLVVSRRGKQGGYQLAREADTISLLEVVRLFEGEVLELSADPAGVSAAVVVQTWQKVREAVESVLAGTTLQDLSMEGLGQMYYI